MAQDQQDTSRTGAAAAAQCVSVEDLLKQVTSELNEFEAKKLGELKTDLDGFVKKKTGLVDDYRKKYPQLRDKWCTQHQLIENLYRALQCAFPDPDWKKIVDECICTNLKSRSCKWQTIAHRRRCCRGKLESALAEAQVKFDWAKKHLDALQANAQKVDAEITDARLDSTTGGLALWWQAEAVREEFRLQRCTICKHGFDHEAFA